jgi:cytochrome c oxidase subunit 3/cytochrome o ubiquinol oxidase subunit 3
MNEDRAVIERVGAIVPGMQELGQFPAPPPIAPEKRLTPAQWGVLSFLCSEVAFFSTLIVAYVVFYGHDSQPGGLGGPTPADALSLQLAIGTTACLLLSSATIHLAERSLRNNRTTLFLQLLSATILLGIAFLSGTAYEWSGLIGQHHLTISRNLFGTTFYTLVGFHALHVTIGVIVMVIVLGIGVRGELSQKTHAGAQLVSWYWHFVDGVWIVVFSVVYLAPHLG